MEHCSPYFRILSTAVLTPLSFTVLIACQAPSSSSRPPTSATTAAAAIDRAPFPSTPWTVEPPSCDAQLAAWSEGPRDLSADDHELELEAALEAFSQAVDEQAGVAAPPPACRELEERLVEVLVPSIGKDPAALYQVVSALREGGSPRFLERHLAHHGPVSGFSEGYYLLKILWPENDSPEEVHLIGRQLLAETLAFADDAASRRALERFVPKGSPHRMLYLDVERSLATWRPPGDAGSETAFASGSSVPAQ